MFVIMLLEKVNDVDVLELLEIIIKAPLPVVYMVLIIMFIKELPVIVASHIPSTPKQPPLSDVERKFDHIQFFNLSLVVVSGKAT